ncbi:DUF5672 family protein [Sphingomonas sp. KC8]|uniref:DUF5672 family protein n=1 Tax=Sphingomonas sp. KC8 TaxID=1030157 RepID=UPI00055E5EB5|nr:DUF5672 family protein [Sphingomonas sp. KC8]
MTASFHLSSPNRLALSQVTLCAVTSVNVEATVRALEACLEQVAFADCMLFTDAPVRSGHPDIRVMPITRLDSTAAYSNFMLFQLADYVKTSHCLIVQWDGYVLDARRWRAEFLDCDYIGASWPQFDDGHDVGNGGFSLRSRRLMDACRSAEFVSGHPEDVAICRTNRAFLDRQGMRFASRELADLFAAERAGDPTVSFGFHGIFNMPQVIGVEAFWDTYRTLDDRSSLSRDFGPLLKALRNGRGSIFRAIRMIADRACDIAGSRSR